MKRVLIAWAQDATPNLGVRVLAEGTAELVRQVEPTAEIVTQNYGRGPAPVNIGVPRALLREFVLDSRGLKRWLRGFDLVVDTRMGDSFADIYGMTRLRAQSAFGEFVHRCGVPLVMSPQTIGPFTTRAGGRWGRRTLRHADLVMARDHESARIAEEMGHPVDVLTTDVVFALPQPEAGERRDVVLNVSGLLWEHDDHGPKDAYRATVRALIDGLRERGRTVTLLAHVLDSDYPDSDGPTVRALGEELGLEAVVPTSLGQVRSLVAGADLVLGSRMHACLNALSTGTPAIPLAYSRKFAPLLADVDWRHVVSLAEPDAAARALALVDAGESLAADAERTRARARELLGVARDALRDVL